jgi:hypothetical protein
MMGADEKLFTVELWDFSGSVVDEESKRQLMANFFHAGIICYSIEDEANIESVKRIVSSRLPHRQVIRNEPSD